MTSWFKRLRYSVSAAAALAFGTLVAVTAPVFGQPSFRAAPLITDDLDPESLRLAIRRSLAYLEKLPPDRVVGAQPRRFTAGEIIHTLLAFEGLLNQWHCLECWRRELTRRFEFNPSSADHRLAEVLVTGYYQPLLEGSLARSASYAFPIYGRPRDLVVADKVTLGNHMAVEKVFGRVQRDHFLPYYSRREIDEAGALRGKNYEIAWVKDPIELFFLHIQGSGILRLSDGRRLHVGYSATNGRPYRSIGRLLIERGKISKTEVSMQSLRRYLAAHPDEIKEIFGYNESYVFFRFLQGGATGSLEVPVTPGRSIATDPNLFPKGAIAFIETQLPLVSGTGEMIGQRPFSRFVLNQDSGGSIRGPQRVDLFFGAGADVEAQAGYMNSAGKLYFLSLKNQQTSSKVGP